MLVSAERQKRAVILESEGKQQSTINIAEAKKRVVVLNSEAVKTEKINQANGEAEAIKSIAEATAKGIESVANAIQTKGGSDAVSMKVAEDYLKAFEGIAKSSKAIIVPTNSSDASSIITQSLAIFDSIKSKK